MKRSENNTKISLKLSKGSTNKWLINQEESSAGPEEQLQSLAAEDKEKKREKRKPTLRVSLPIRYFKNKKMNPNEGKNHPPTPLNSPPFHMMELFRQPPPAHQGQGMRPPAPVSATPLRTVRHPIPTGKIRTSMVHGTNPIQFPILPPPPPPPKPTNQMVIAPVKNTPDYAIVTPTKLNSHNTIVNDSEISRKHILPGTVEGYKSSIAKQNLEILSDVATTLIKSAITVSNFTQTEEVIIISKDDNNNLFNFCNGNGLTVAELKKLIIEYEKWKLSLKKKELETIQVIDLEMNQEINSDDKKKVDAIFNTLLKHSNSNKAELLNSAPYINKGTKIPGSPALPEGSPSVPTKVRTTPHESNSQVVHPSTNPTSHSNTSSSTCPIIENQNNRDILPLDNSEILAFINAIETMKTLQKKITGIATIPPLLQQVQTVQQQQTVQTEAVPTTHSYGGSTALQYPSAASLQWQQMTMPHQELPLFQPSVPPPSCHIPPPQTPQQFLLNCGQERPAMHTGTSLEQQQAAGYPIVYNHQSLQNNGPTILNQQQLQVPQFVNNDPRRNSAQTPMPRAQTPHRIPRVRMSTDEANLHSLHNPRVQSARVHPYAIYNRPNYYWPNKK